MKERALVLSGGGHVGIGWEAGLLAGLAELGVDPRQADLVIGTSAGAVVGAQIASGVDPVHLATVLRNEASAAPAAAAGSPPDLSSFFRKMLDASRGLRPAKELYAEMGADALKAQTMSEEACVAMVARLFGGALSGAWPARDFACPAFNAETGDLQVWNRESGVDLIRAITSSCVLPGVFPPITIGNARYFEGGLQSRTSAHLATGYERILVVALRVGEGASELNRQVSEHYTRQTDMELRDLQAGGARTLVVTPDPQSRGVFGPNLMDVSRRAGAVDEGLRQGRAQAQRVAEFWN